MDKGLHSIYIFYLNIMANVILVGNIHENYLVAKLVPFTLRNVNACVKQLFYVYE